mgnify:CR=1 FL=1|jgi:GTP-binding protein SAR1
MASMIMDWWTGLSEWYQLILKRLGFAAKEASLVVVGLDNAGKTTLLHRLCTGKVRNFVPTERAKEESFSLGGVKFRGWDLGGHDAVRHLWLDYYIQHDAIVFMVDSTDVRRFEEAKEELEDILEDEEVFDKPVLILSNKIDRKDATLLDDVVKALDVEREWPERTAPIKIFEISIVKGLGYEEAFQWLAAQI